MAVALEVFAELLEALPLVLFPLSLRRAARSLKPGADVVVPELNETFEV